MIVSKRHLLLLCIISSLSLGSAFFMFAPEERINNFVELGRRVWDPKAQLCLDYIRDDLKDPSSARLIDSVHSPTVDDLAKDNGVFIHYRAKNSYDAYVSGSISCQIDGAHARKSTTLAEMHEDSIKTTRALEAIQGRIKFIMQKYEHSSEKLGSAASE